MTSKLSPYEMGRVRAEAAVEGILQRLGTDYVVGLGMTSRRYSSVSCCMLLSGNLNEV